MPDDLSQRDLLIRIDARTQAHYQAFQEFKAVADKRLDAHAEKIRTLEGFRARLKGGVAVIAGLATAFKLFVSANAGR